MKPQQKMSGKRKGKEAASDPYIPTDLCEEILYRLPSNDLRKFKLVCKDWRRLISSKGFIQKHLERSKADCNHLRILVNLNSAAEIIDCANSTSKKILSSDHDERHILGCCDGLVLYYDQYHRKIAAMNTCTGQSSILVPIPNQKLNTLSFSWFGHHPSTGGEYVLVLVYRESGSITFQVYSLSPDHINSLPLISSSTLDLQGMEHSNMIRGTLLHGRLHCTVLLFNILEPSFEFVILVYDFETNKIMKMTHPAKHLTRMLGVVDGCLCLIGDKQVWMMKEYGVEESWTKYANIDGFPLAFCPDGDVIITSDDGFTKVISKYSLREREAKILCKLPFNIALRDCIATACIDSLISPTLLWREEAY